MGAFMKMRDSVWNSLVTSMQSGDCVLVLGPDVPPAGEESPGGEARPTRDMLRDHLLEELREVQPQVDEASPFAVAQLYEENSALSTSNLRNVATGFYRRLRCQPGALHRALAELPFGLVLTTSHDNLMESALADRSLTVARRWYHFRGEPRDNVELDEPPVPGSPVVYHLFGACDEPSSLVLTENDLLDFLIHAISSRPKLPDSLRLALRHKTFLFFGFGIRHWNVRVLLKLLVRMLEVAGGSVALESLGGLGDRERQQTVLFYKRGSRIEVADMEALAFIAELQSRLAAAGGYSGPRRSTLRRPSVFISYERRDEDLARRLFEALPPDKFDPWLDRECLGPGEDWNAELEQRLAETDYALVLNGPHLADKKVGYVNKEIQALLERQKCHQRGTRFLLPLLVDAMDPEHGLADLRFLQQMPLRANQLQEDADAVSRTLLRDHQLRIREG